MMNRYNFLYCFLVFQARKLDLLIQSDSIFDGLERCNETVNYRNGTVIVGESGIFDASSMDTDLSRAVLHVILGGLNYTNYDVGPILGTYETMSEGCSFDRDKIAETLNAALVHSGSSGSVTPYESVSLDFGPELSDRYQVAIDPDTNCPQFVHLWAESRNGTLCGYIPWFHGEGSIKDKITCPNCVAAVA